MANESPFFLSKVECPICKTINEYETVRVGAYLEQGRDTDFCPMEIKWRYPRYQGHNPLVYFTATCSNCFYSRELTNSFKDWKKDTNYKTYRLKTVKDKHLDQLATADSIIKRMGEAIDLTRYPNKSAILRFHLAVFDELLCDRPSKLDLGRFYLRIGWVFRDLGKGEDPHLQFLNGLMLEIDRHYVLMESALKDSREKARVFLRHMQTHFEADQIPAQVKSLMLSYRDKFDSEIISLESLYSSAESQLQSISDLIAEYKSTALGGDGSASDIAFGQHATFVDFLLDLKKTWAGVVLNEQEALEKAVYYYKEAFSEGRDISPGYQQIQASYMIAELSRRIGDYDGARQYFNSTIKHGQEFIYENRRDQSRTVLARKILELAMEQGKLNIKSLKST